MPDAALSTRVDLGARVVRESETDLLSESGGGRFTT